MLKNLKISTVISVSVGLISIICMAIFYVVLNGNVSKVVETKALDNMTTSLDGQANLLTSLSLIPRPCSGSTQPRTR
ncbi:MAG: hypothetical protein II820_08060 [Ruminiclostridium sp.]|nr:hypothetical protein [Ruminiclostridium sp.]